MIAAKSARLKHLFRIVNGATPSPDPVNWNGDVAWATPVDIGRYDGDVIERTERSMSRVGLRSCAAEVAPTGSLLLSTRAPIGYVAESAAEMAINQGCRMLIPRMTVDSRFYRYVLSTRRPQLQALGRGSTFVELSTHDLGNVQLPTPPLGEQRSIVRFLDGETSRIHGLVERKRGLLAELEALLRSSLALAIPDGAPRLALRRCVRKFVDYRGGTPSKSAHGIPLITARNVRNGKLDFGTSQEYVSRATYEEWMGRGFPAIGDVVITTEAPLGEVAQIESLPVALAQRVLLLQPNERVLPEYLRVYLLSPQAREELEKRGTGSTAVGIKASHLKGLPVAVPPLDAQRQIVATVGKASEKSERIRLNVLSSIAKLREYRAALITAAVTGQIDVRSAA